MRNKIAKQLRAKASNIDSKDTTYVDKTFHHVYNGKDRNGDKTFVEIIDSIKLGACTRLEYKRLKHDYKINC